MIRDTCESYSEAIPTRPRLIKDRYLRIFSTLVLIGKLPYLPAFQRLGLVDEKFPDTILPGPWEQLPSYKSMFDDFKNHQWIFFPVILDRDSLDDTWLPPERILPVHVQAKIREQLYSDRAAITKVQFHPSCNSLVKVSWRKNRSLEASLVYVQLLTSFSCKESRHIWDKPILHIKNISRPTARGTLSARSAGICTITSGPELLRACRQMPRHL